MRREATACSTRLARVSRDAASAVVVGAGVFGASIAYALAGRGFQVTLVEAQQPGHVRSSSGGESRLIRCAHGSDRHYTRWACDALAAWRALERDTSTDLLVDSGVVWFAHREDGWEAASATALADEGIPAERLTGAEAAKLFPDLRHDDLAFVLHEPAAGVLRARRAVSALVAGAVARGARLVIGHAAPHGATVDVDGQRLLADRVVWACGPWLPQLFGELLAPVGLRVTKQDVTFFAAPPAWATPPTPGWIDYDGATYGLGDLDGRGVKCAPDVEGPDFDPSRGERHLSVENERRARTYMAHRFPALANAPLIGSRTCQYTLTPDTEFILAPHPDLDGVWVAGGGSGHGFKHGPVIGEHVADLVTGTAAPAERFAIGPRSHAAALRTAGR